MTERTFKLRKVFITLEGGGRAQSTSARPGSSGPESPCLVFCRCEDDEGDGFHVIAEANDVDDGNWVASELQSMARPNMSMRCELVANTDRAFTAWAKHSVRRKRTLAKYGENRR